MVLKMLINIYELIIILIYLKNRVYMQKKTIILYLYHVARSGLMLYRSFSRLVKADLFLRIHFGYLAKPYDRTQKQLYGNARYLSLAAIDF